MKLSGIVTQPPTVRNVTLKNPRPGEPATKAVTEVPILDDDGGDIIAVSAWGDGPEARALAAMERGKHVTVSLTGLRTFMNRTSGSLLLPVTGTAKTL